MNLKILSVIWVFAGLLSACAGPMRSTALEREPSNTDQILTFGKPTDKEEAMFRLLVAEIAGQRGDLDTSIAYLTSTFEHVADPAIADHATQIALYAQDY